MTSVQIFSVIWLVVIFAACIWRHTNVGLAMLPASFILAEVAGISPKQLYQGFPTSLVILILGVMFLWNHARNSGLADLIIYKTVRMTRGRLWLLPWTTCFLSAGICAIGALPAAALVITLPVAIRIAERENIRPALMGVVTIQGACIGGFSPISPWGSLVISQVQHAGLPFLPSYFVASMIVLNICVAAVAYFAFGGAELIRRGVVATPPTCGCRCTDLPKWTYCLSVGIAARCRGVHHHGAVEVRCRPFGIRGGYRVARGVPW